MNEERLTQSGGNLPTSISNKDNEIKSNRSNSLTEQINPRTSSANNSNNDIEADLTEQSPLLNPAPVPNETAQTSFNGVCSTLVNICLNLAMIIVGALNVNQCDVLKLVPIYLIVAGALGITLKLFVILCQRCSKYRATAYFLCIIALLECIFIIIISYLVYSTKPDFDPSSSSYCNKVAYYFAFWLVTVYWIIASLGAAFLCCACVLTCLVNARD